MGSDPNRLRERNPGPVEGAGNSLSVAVSRGRFTNAGCPLGLSFIMIYGENSSDMFFPCYQDIAWFWVSWVCGICIGKFAMSRMWCPSGVQSRVDGTEVQRSSFVCCTSELCGSYTLWNIQNLVALPP